MKQYYVQLAEKFTPLPVSECYNWYVSEKLDGQRAIWDGGRSRGRVITNVHHANTQKDTDKTYLATGLWSRYGKVIHAPDWFLDQLPTSHLWGLDMELYGGRNNFQWTTGVVRSKRGRDADWKQIAAHIFDVVPLGIFLKSRFINLPTAVFSVTAPPEGIPAPIDLPFNCRLDRLYSLKLPDTAPNVRTVMHIPLLGKEGCNNRLQEVIESGGEGLMFRSPADLWKPERVRTLRKLKPVYTATGTVIGEAPGKGKYVGLVGALIIESKTHGQFQMSGMTDEQRAPGTFPVGSSVQYKYDGLTNDGLPRNVRYKAQ